MIFYSGLTASAKKIMDINAANKLLARTINIGYTFDAPTEGAWGNTVRAEDIVKIKQAGFTAIRLPVQWVARMDTAVPYAIHPEFLKRIDWVITQALKNKLAIVVENCLDAQLMAEPEEHRDRFLKLWEQLSLHYAAYPQQVMFELMAEPRGKFDSVWQEYFTAALSVVRSTNPLRPVIIGPGFYNSLRFLNSLHLPESDQYLIVTFHLYDPLQFTMQGEKWLPYGKPMEWLGTKWTATPAEQKAVTDNLNMVSKWAADHKRPIFMGEFGASDHADMASRAAFLAFYREQAELRNFSWGVWSFNTGFSILDKSTGEWRKELLDALIPPG